MFEKFPSIENFANVRKSVLRLVSVREGFVPRPVVYRAKVKLHGCNVGVRIGDDGSITPQSRNRVLSIGNDQFGFAMWMMKNADMFASEDLRGHTVFGEWAGPGIQKGVAVSDIPEKSFFPFLIRPNRDDDEKVYGNEDDLIEYHGRMCPDVIAEVLSSNGAIDLASRNVYPLPWHGEPITINFANSAQCQLDVDAINDMVLAVEQEDPFIKDVFGVSGVGEGLVFYPEFGFGRLAFKAKGEKHAVKKTKSKAPVEIDVEVFGKASTFADSFVTPARLEQICRAVNNGELIFDVRKTGMFIGAMCKDVEKESIEEVVASGLEWREISHAVAAKSRVWFLDNCSKID